MTDGNRLTDNFFAKLMNFFAGEEFWITDIRN